MTLVVFSSRLQEDKEVKKGDENEDKKEKKEEPGNDLITPAYQFENLGFESSTPFSSHFRHKQDHRPMESSSPSQKFKHKQDHRPMESSSPSQKFKHKQDHGTRDKTPSAGSHTV